MEEDASGFTDGSFGVLLRELRLAQGLTQEVLAERARLGVRTLQALESGTQKPRNETRERLAIGLQLVGEQRRKLESAALPEPRRRGTVSPRPASKDSSNRSVHGAGHSTLPNALTTLVGRKQEILDIKRLLATSRLVTLTGPGGCGKTRLALQVASEAIDDYPDGVWLVELAVLNDPSLVAQTIVNTLGLSERPDQSPLSVLIAYVRHRHCLLVVDNCEHLLDGCAPVISSLLQNCPRLTVLTTSRQQVQIFGEVQWHVPSLPTPDPASLALPDCDLGSLVDGYPAIQLFGERTRAVLPNFAITPHNFRAIAEICWHLDGLPLAIELAAARARTLGVHSLAERLDQRFQLLTSGSRVALPRQQTLQATIDWSYDLLTESERSLFGQLSVFAGGWTLDAAETVFQDGEVAKTLSGLVEKSLVLAADDLDGTIRYRLLETIRQYAVDRLERSGDADRVRDQHAGYYLAVATSTKSGPEGFNRLEREYNNLRAALRWFLSQGRAEQALSLGGSLYGFWAFRGYVNEGRQYLGTALALSSPEIPPQVRAVALQGAARLAFNQSDFAASGELYTRSLDCYREAGNLRRVSQILMAQGHLSREQGNFERASALFDEAIALTRVTGSRGDLSDALSLSGLLALQTGDYDGARESLDASLQINRERGDELGVAWAKSRLGHVAHAQGDLATSERLYAESLTTMRRWNDTRGIANLLTNLGMVSVDAGDLVKADAYLRESAEIQRRLQDRAGLAMLLDGLAGLAAARSQSARALRLAGLAESLRQAVGTPLARNLTEWRERILAPARQATDVVDVHPHDRHSYDEPAKSIDQVIDVALSDEVTAGPNGTAI